MNHHTLTKHLRRWANARESRNTPGGHGKTGTALLRDAADRIESLEKAYFQACTNLATIRPSHIEGATIGDDAQRYHDALLAGWGGIDGWDAHSQPRGDE